MNTEKPLASRIKMGQTITHDHVTFRHNPDRTGNALGQFEQELKRIIAEEIKACDFNFQHKYEYLRES